MQFGENRASLRELFIRAARSRLAPDSTPERMSADAGALGAFLVRYAEQAERLCRLLAKEFQGALRDDRSLGALRYQFGLLPGEQVSADERASFHALARSLQRGMQEAPAEFSRMIERAVDALLVELCHDEVFSTETPKKSFLPRVCQGASPPSRQTPPSSPANRVPAAAPAAAPSAAAQWRVLPVPADEPEPHTEFAEGKGTSPEGFTILAARARGKRHKHEGTNCDDWFDYAASGRWTVLAVADGGGSYRFSRIGAKAACQSAVAGLAEALKDHDILPRTRAAWAGDVFKNPEPDLLYVRRSLEQAMNTAWRAVRTAAAERVENAGYTRILGRPPVVKDFYTTLLVAVHVLVRVEGTDFSLVFGCAVGDGMIAVIDQQLGTRLLMIPDSGAHAGEVRFLEEREITPEKLSSKVFCFCNPMRALLLVTDGVADDYFPNDPRMCWLYGDLLLNGILPVAPVEAAQAEAALAPIRREIAARGNVADFPKLAMVEGVGGPQAAPIRSLESYAKSLGREPAKVLASPPLLWAGCQGLPLCPQTEPEVRLRVWLDSYCLRGSFDDRTLVVLHG